MGRVKGRNTKKSFMKDHDCRFCLYYGSCSHKECVFDDTLTVDGNSADRGGESQGNKQCSPMSDATV